VLREKKTRQTTPGGKQEEPINPPSRDCPSRLKRKPFYESAKRQNRRSEVSYFLFDKENGAVRIEGYLEPTASRSALRRTGTEGPKEKGCIKTLGHPECATVTPTEASKRQGKTSTTKSRELTASEGHRKEEEGLQKSIAPRRSQGQGEGLKMEEGERGNYRRTNCGRHSGGHFQKVPTVYHNK